MFQFFKSFCGRFHRTSVEPQAVRGNVILRRAFLPCLMVAAAVTMVGQSAASALGNDIRYYGTQPAGTPAFGQQVMISGQIIRDDGGVKANQTVQLWFSGRHGVRAGNYFVRTDSNGRFNALMVIPRAWVNGINGDKTWVDVNISCATIGVTKLFRVRDK